MAFWYRRSKLLFDKSFHSKITTLPILNHQPVSIAKVSSFVNMSSHVGSSGYRCYHVDSRVKVIYKKLEKALVGVVVSLIGLTIWIADVETIPYTKRKHFLLMPAGLERVVGENHFRKMKAGFVGKVLPVMHPDRIRVTIVLNRVVQALQATLKKYEFGLKVAISHLEGLQWEVLVVEDDAAYACCLPGGKIVVFTGLLKHFKTDEEIATIIGHEVAHVVARHFPKRLLTKNFWRAFVRQIFYMVVKLDLDPRVVFFMLDLPFSPRMEIEANDLGLTLMACAEYDPRVTPKVFEKMGQVSAFHDTFRSIHRERQEG